MTLRRAAMSSASVLVLFLAASGCGDDSGNNVLSLEEGQCFQDPDDLSSEITNVEIVDCDEPHDNEIFHVEELEGDDDDFPGTDEIAQETEVCDEEAEDFLDGDATAAGLTVTALTPTENSWEHGDRAIVCFVFSSDGDELDESVEGAAEDLESDDGTTETTAADDSGEDEDFSALIDDCEGGDMGACDDLYFATPVGSPEERIGSTCGGRSEEELFGSCEDTFG